MARVYNKREISKFTLLNNSNWVAQSDPDSDLAKNRISDNPNYICGCLNFA